MHMAQTLIMIRHAEKPGGKWPGPGFTEDGEEDEESLVIRGWQRAGGLALLFSGLGGMPRPQRIYASGIVKQDGSGSRSKRPLQTVMPLCRKLDIQPIDTYSKGEEVSLASEISNLDETTLISWQHESIPNIIRELTGNLDLDWPDSRFDMIWTVSRAARSDPWTFSQSGQGILFGDQSASAD
jgi:broad specificity phosphatase PhoE